MGTDRIYRVKAKIKKMDRINRIYRIK